jgi:hypothetical protein
MTRPTFDVLVPVLWRPHRIVPLADRLREATTHPYRLLFLVDADDHDTRQTIHTAGLNALVCPPSADWSRATYPSKVNHAWGLTRAPYVLVIGDDVDPRSGWDDAVLEVARAHPDAGVIATNDLHNVRSIYGVTATHPVIVRAYVQRYGSATADGRWPVFAEAYRHNYCDGELVAVARSRGAFRAAPHAIIAHQHVQADRSLDDVTYQIGRQHAERDRATQQRRLRAFDRARMGDDRLRGRRILLTNGRLNRVGGSESWLISMHAELQRRGADVTVWTPEPGALAARLRAPAALRGRWDVALANHATTVPGALRHAPVVIQTCHGILTPERPHPDATAHVAISPEVHAHLRRQDVQPAALIPNGVDLLRYRPRRRPSAYPSAPARLLLVSNYAEGAAARLAAAVRILRDDGRAPNLTLDVLRHAPDTAPAMATADVVVGLGRTALEGVASGAHVIAWDHRRYQDPIGDGPLDPRTDAYWRAAMANWSGRAHRLQPTDHDLAAWIAEYTPAVVTRNRAAALAHHDIVDTVTRYVALIDRLAAA